MMDAFDQALARHREELARLREQFPDDDWGTEEEMAAGDARMVAWFRHCRESGGWLSEDEDGMLSCQSAMRSNGV